MPKGLKTLEAEKEEKAKSSGLLDLFLVLKKDSPVAFLRFLTDTDDLEWARFHSIPTKSPRSGKTYNKEIYCMMQDGEDCMYCNQVGQEVAKVRRKLFFYVWVYGILHTKQTQPEWAPVDYLGQTYYKEEVNNVKILRTGPGKNDYIENRFINWAKRFKTLVDRDYEWARTGEGLDTTYDLIPSDDGPTEVDKAITTAFAAAKPLSEIMNRFKPARIPNDSESGAAETDEATVNGFDPDQELKDIFKDGA